MFWKKEWHIISFTNEKLNIWAIKCTLAQIDTLDLGFTWSCVSSSVKQQMLSNVSKLYWYYCVIDNISLLILWLYLCHSLTMFQRLPLSCDFSLLANSVAVQEVNQPLITETANLKETFNKLNPLQRGTWNKQQVKAVILL